MLAELVLKRIWHFQIKHHRTLKPIVISSYAEGRKFATEALLNTEEFKVHRLNKFPSTTSLVTKDDALLYYRQLQSIRKLETVITDLFNEKLVRGFCHLCTGQEAVCVGVSSVLRPVDKVIASYRDHGWAYVLGVSLYSILSELMGKSSGCTRGKGGSMHMYKRNFFGGCGIIGSSVPLGAGIAFASKYRDTGGVAVAVHGDGAANQGQVFETYNMAKLWNIPVIFLCENNGYGMYTSVDRAAASTEFYVRGDYVPGIRVDGMDMLSVREALKFAVDYCSSGNGPIVVEATTYRYSGHFIIDRSSTYRNQEELERMMRTRDPILIFKEKCLAANLVTTDEIQSIDEAIDQEIEEAVESAKSAEEVSLEEIASDVYYMPIEKEVRGVFSHMKYKHLNIATPFNNH